VAIIVAATNSYAERQQKLDEITLYSREWKNTTPAEIWRYIGCLVYMGMHIEREHTLYWSDSHRLGRFIGLKRYEQLHRYFHLRDEAVHPQKSHEGWFWRIEPIGTMIRQACKAMWSVGSHLAIDEAMIAFTGRTDHTIKIKNKPISQGFKIWVLAEKGYVWSWLWHSGEDAVESIPVKGMKVQMPVPFLPILLAPTFALVIKLAQEVLEVLPNQVFCLFLDNLFLKLDVAQALLAIGVLCMGTTRKNSKGLPQELVELKERNSALVWDSTLARIINSVYCFLWQDNNAVLGITTAYSLLQRVRRKRKRPALTSTNARIVRPVFGNAIRKWLWIPLAIDAYNHHMNAVDRNNQLRRTMTVCRPQEQRVWRPQWLWLLDICLVNSFLI
jgi:hypothetical protein